MNRSVLHLLFIGALLLTIKVQGQSCITARYFGLTVHPFGDDQAALQPYKLDKEAHFVLNFGGFMGYERFVWGQYLSVKAMQGLFTDCSAGWAGYTHIGFRGLVARKNGHRIYFGLGPTFFYRKDWNRFPSYIDKGTFTRYESDLTGPVQCKIFWYACEFEYDVRLNDKWDLNTGFTPGLPFALTFSVGAKYWISKNFPEKRKYVIPGEKQKKKKN